MFANARLFSFRRGGPALSPGRFAAAPASARAPLIDSAGPAAWQLRSPALIAAAASLRAYAAGAGRARDRRTADASAAAAPRKNQQQPAKKQQTSSVDEAEGLAETESEAELRKWGIVNGEVVPEEDPGDADDDVVERKRPASAKAAEGASSDAGAKKAGKRGTRWYQREIERLCTKEGDGAAAALDEALRHHDRMAKEHVPMNLPIYNALIDALAGAGRAERADALYADMRRRAIRPDLRTIVGVVNACAESIRRARLSSSPGDVARVDKLLARVEELVKRDSARWEAKPHRILYNAALKAAAVARRPEAAEAWLQEMRKAGVRPDEVTLSTLLLAAEDLGPEGLERHAFRWAAELRAQDGVRPTTAVYNSLLQACRSAGDAESLASVYAEMRTGDGAASRPDAATYGILLAGLTDGAKAAAKSPGEERRAKQSAADRAKAYLEQARAGRVPLDAPAYNAFLGVMAWVGDAEGAQEAMQRMRAERVAPDQLSYVEVLRAHTRAGDYEGAWKWWEALRSQERWRPSLFAATAALHSLARAADAEGASLPTILGRALTIAEAIRGGRHRPDSVVRELLARLAQRTSSEELRAAALDERPVPEAGERGPPKEGKAAPARGRTGEKPRHEERREEASRRTPRRARSASS